MSDDITQGTFDRDADRMRRRLEQQSEETTENTADSSGEPTAGVVMSGGSTMLNDDITSSPIDRQDGENILSSLSTFEEVASSGDQAVSDNGGAGSAESDGVTLNFEEVTYEYRTEQAVGDPLVDDTLGDVRVDDSDAGTGNIMFETLTDDGLDGGLEG